MRIALVHYWLVGMRGGEKVIESLCQLYPNADIYTHVYDPFAISKTISRHNVHTTFISKLPFSKKYYQNYLPLMPLALEQLDLRGYDLVISSESGPAKGIIVDPDSTHICYCHSPMRYVWDMYPQYLNSSGFLKRLLMVPLIHYLKIWDRCSADRVDYFISNSAFVAKRINKYYRRDSTVINPPVSVTDFYITEDDKLEDFYLIVGQLVEYKKALLAVEAFNISGKKLIVIGEGEQFDSIQKIAKSNITILGRQSYESIKKHYSMCKALVFPGVEDFGIVPVEAMASGRPVIAYRKGGALETVVDGVTGMFFDEQSVMSLNNAVNNFEKNINTFLPYKIREHAEKFNREIFKDKINKIVEDIL